MSTSASNPESVTAPFDLAPGGFVLVVSGPSGAGKGTLVERLMKARPECVFSISATTRPIRTGEVDGVQYVFLTRAEFEKRRAAGTFLEWAEVHGQFYATPAQPVDDHVQSGHVVVLDIDVQGGASVRRARPDAVSVFVYPPSFEVLRQRLVARNTDHPEVVELRLKNAPEEMAQSRDYDYLIINDDLEAAAARLIAIVDAERARVRRMRRLG